MQTIDYNLARAIKHSKGYLYHRPSSQLKNVMYKKGWDYEDVSQQFLDWLLTHTDTGTGRYRNRWLEKYWNYSDISQLKQFCGWTKKEVNKFIRWHYIREFEKLKDEGVAKKTTLCYTIEYGNTSEVEHLVQYDGLKQLEARLMIDEIEMYMKDASPRERFIFLYNCGIVKLKWDNGRVINYPEGSVSKKTFYKHKTQLEEKLKGLFFE